MNERFRLVEDRPRPPADEVGVEAIRHMTSFRAYLTPTQRVLLTEWLKGHGVDYMFSVEVD